MNIIPIAVDAKALARPAELLIEKFAKALGIIFEPARIRRKAEAESDAKRIIAKADADALVIRAQGEIRVADIRRRAAERWLRVEERNQSNLETIGAKAIRAIPLKKPRTKKANRPGKEAISDDWFFKWVDCCKVVSDDEMQNLWAKLLAGEFQQPGRFSPQTVTILSMLTPKQAKLFNTLCSFSWDVCDYHGPLIYDLFQPVYSEKSITPEFLNDLVSLGLISFGSGVEHFLRQADGTGFPQVLLKYFDNSYKIGDIDEFPLGKVTLTGAGRELQTLCAEERIPAFGGFVKSYLSQEQKIKLETLKKPVMFRRPGFGLFPYAAVYSRPKMPELKYYE